jgi:aerobic-type carbon monoxide dehydrogenase small subunit (CoxS/CutS family)/uncharacterized OsmC-like protein
MAPSVATTTLTLRINGEARTVAFATHHTLLEVLREECGLTGTKHGCELGECGTCAVLVDGRPVLSCLVLAAGIAGRAIETVEGLQDGNRLHPLQAAFADLGAAQCGYCTPGILMTAKALLAEKNPVTDEEIRAALAGNLCRCTGYQKIVQAVQWAAARERGEEAAPPPEAFRGAPPPVPLVFKVAGPDRAEPEALAPATAPTAIRVEARALEGMQKEALVRVGDGPAWRMVSDEGPYLKGTDLAPFPLAFFTAGTQFSLLSTVARTARSQGVELTGLRVVQDNYYSMSGSFLRGDVVGGARPAEAVVEVESAAPEAIVRRLVEAAAREYPAHPVVRDPLENAFSLTHNGRSVGLAELPPADGAGIAEPGPRLAALVRAPPESFLPEIIRKGESAEVVHGVEGGAGSSLAPEQKRTLHVRGEARLREGLSMETRIELLKPIGSSFFFRADETAALGGKGLAPPPLAYVSAGVAFCYMTQLGRYAEIVKWPLDSCAVVQDNVLETSGSLATGDLRSTASPFATHVFLRSGRSDEEARRLVVIGERTCFLHAAMRGAYPTRVRVELNGRPL